MLGAAGHLAVFAACYVAAQTLMVSLLVGQGVCWRAIMIALLTALGTYLVDRSGPWPGHPDRGDLRAHPKRVRFLRRHAPCVRVTAVTALTAAFLLAVPWGLVATVVPLSVIGLLCYARWALPGRRLKDRLWIKNPAVAASITMLAVALAFAHGQEVATSTALIAAGVVLLRVWADAMRCDIDDAESDARQGTRTIANVLGPEAVWRGAISLDTLAAALALLTAGALGWPVAIALAMVPLAMSIVLTVYRPTPIRDLVDATGALSVLIAWLLASGF
ncbi:MAG: UbiA family prenyltransferase [Phycisphaerales bacterium]|nr:UbiA family prenyltransferase [Phycisphaerales bacterium]